MEVARGAGPGGDGAGGSDDEQQDPSAAEGAASEREAARAAMQVCQCEGGVGVCSCRLAAAGCVHGGQF